MSATPKSAAKKPERFDAVAEAVLSLTHRHGVDSVTHSSISRITGVSRAWLYKYVGSTREDLVAFATDQIGAQFTDHGLAQTKLTKDEWYAELRMRFSKLLDQTQLCPGIPKVYFQYRGTPTALGKRLEKVASQNRNREITELTAIFGLSVDEATQATEVLSAIRLGLSHWFAPSQLPSYAMKRTALGMSRDDVLALFERIARATLGAHA